MNNEELKPCPFCGGEAHLLIFNAKSYVKCGRCEIETPHKYWSEEEAIAVWNRRNYPEKQESSKLSYADVEKMVKPLEWELECENGDSVAKVGKALLRITYWSNEAKYIVFCDTTIIKGGFALLDEAKHTAQEFLVDLVADALGVERSGE